MTYKFYNWLVNFSLWAVCCALFLACSQSLRHISTLTISLVNEVLQSFAILPVVLNANSEETIDTRLVKMSHVNCESIENLV